MRTVLDIVYGVVGQLIYCDAPEGRPSAVTSLTVFRWDQSDIDTAPEAAAGAGAVETNPNTTTDAIAGTSSANPKRLPLTLTTGAERERLYLLADNATGEREWVEPMEIAADDYITLRAPLHNDYSSGSTFQSTRMVATVDPAWVDDITNLDDSAGANPMYRARWEYVVGGKTYVQDTYFNLVRYAGRHGVTPQDVENSNPGWLDRLSTDHKKDQGRRLIDEAFRQVKLDMHGVWSDDASLAESEVIDELVRWKAVELTELGRFLAGHVDDEARHKAAELKYQKRLGDFVTLSKKAPVRDSTGAAAIVKPIGLTRR